MRICAKSSNFAAIFNLSKKGGIYAKDWNGISFAGLHYAGKGR